MLTCRPYARRAVLRRSESGHVERTLAAVGGVS